MKISRDTDMYKEIESFEGYELTQCCIYEMAIRSKWFSNELQLIDSLYNKYKKESTKEFKVPSTKTKIIDKCFSLGLNQYVEHPLLDSVLGRKAQLIYKEIVEFNSKKKKITVIKNDEYVEFLQSIDFNGFTLNNVLKFDSYSINPSFYDGDIEINLKNLLKSMHAQNQMHLLESTTYTIPNFSRPQLYFKAVQERTVSTQLDFSLSKHELINYISQIKDQLDMQDEIGISPTSMIDTIPSLIAELSQLQQKHGEKQYTLATMFYIYDAFKVGMKQSQIKLEISHYNNVNIDERTIKKYHETMKGFIDDENFKSITSSVLL